MAQLTNRLRPILDAMPLKFFLKDTENRILLTNKAVADSLGVSVEEIENTDTRLWYPDDADAYYRDDQEVMRSGEPKLGIVEPLAVDGADKLWIRTDKYPYWDADGQVVGILVFIRDATEQAEAEAALRESEHQLARILESISDYVWSAEFEPDGNVSYSYYSPVVEKITGRPPEFYLAGPDRWRSTVHPEDLPRAEKAVARIMSGSVDSLTEEYRIHRPDGTVRWVRDSVTLTSREGGHVRVDGIVTDVTERKRARTEQRRLEERVRHAQKLESLGVLAGGIAHDFNNILTGILGHAGLAEMEVEPGSPVADHLALIEESALRAASLCKQMLAYSGSGRFSVKTINLSDLIEETRHMLELSISKKAALEFDLDAAIRAIDADASQTQQVLVNLLTNASEAIGNRGGTITVRTGTMECDAAYLGGTYLDENLEAGTYAYVEVQDDGYGMDADTRERAFDPFFTTKFTGRGLGLAAVLGIVRGHGGAIKVRSKSGKGTTVRVLFPVSDSPLGDDAEVRDRHEDWRGHGVVLVVDDEAVVRTFAKHTLQRCGFEVLLAEDGRRALEIYRKRAADITVVLLDLTMPQLGGEDVFREMRRIRPGVRVILSSGYNEQDTVTQSFARQLAGFLQKPYRPMELVERVRRVVEEDDL